MQAGAQQMTLPRPGRVLKVVLVGLFAIWLIFALAINWGGVSFAAFLLFVGNTGGILQGEVWRLATAMLMHLPNSIGHILGSMVGLYFLGSSLEEAWGGRRFAWFLGLTGVLSYATTFVCSLLLPADIMAKLGSSGAYFGVSPVVYGVAIAWACSFKGRQVMLMFVLPVSSRALIWITVGLATLSLIAQSAPTSGHIASFAGMGFGYLLGGGTPPPLRNALLRYKLASLERKVSDERESRRQKVKKSGFKVVPGGKDGYRFVRDDQDDDSPGGGMLH